MKKITTISTSSSSSTSSNKNEEQINNNNYLQRKRKKSFLIEDLFSSKSPKKLIKGEKFKILSQPRKKLVQPILINNLINKKKFGEKNNNDENEINHNLVNSKNSEYFFNEIEKNEGNIFNDSYFTEIEIKEYQNVKKEYQKLIKFGNFSETDKFIKLISFFVKKNLNAEVRKIYYTCLLNYGFPNIDEFNSFYDKFLSEVQKKKIPVIPDKMSILFYNDYILKILLDKKHNNAQSKLISEFFFNYENLATVKQKFSFINVIKNETKENIYLVQNYLNDKFDDIFINTKQKINENYIKAKPILCKIITNLLFGCKEYGYLNYCEAIKNENILFNGVRMHQIKGENKESHIKQMISLKLFGSELSDKQFNTIIKDYFLNAISNSYFNNY